MPYRLHPSGYCVAFNEETNNNLIPGKPCKCCGRVAGHKYGCPELENLPGYFESGKSSRGSLFNAVAVLWSRSVEKSFITFTLPSLSSSVYQKSIHSVYTGDVAITAKFSKVLEAYALKIKRRTGKKLSYVWVSEAQTSRQEKFGGVGDLHFHLVVNVDYKNHSKAWKDSAGRWRYPFISAGHELEIKWLQKLWCEHLEVEAVNCVHVDPLPDCVKSIPSYLAKYLGKGSMRKIVSRRFSASRDLTKFKPITIPARPGECYRVDIDTGEMKFLESVELINRQERKFENYTCITEYYSTSDVLSKFGAWMEYESAFVGGAKGRAADFSEAAQEARKDRAYWNSVVKAFARPDVIVEVRQLVKNVRRVHSKPKKIVPLLLGLSYPT